MAILCLQFPEGSTKDETRQLNNYFHIYLSTVIILHQLNY